MRWGELCSVACPPTESLAGFALSSSTPPQGGSEKPWGHLPNREARAFQQPLTNRVRPPTRPNAFPRICGGGRRRARGYPEGLACSGIFPSRGGAVPPPSAGIARPGRERLAHLPAFPVTGFSSAQGMLERPPVVLRFSGGGGGAERRSRVAAQQRRRTPIMQIIISENSINSDKIR